MFQINPAKLSDFDTQVMTLITLSPGSWRLGAGKLVCHHKELGWFHRHWFFGVQPMIITPGCNRQRALTWRGQILLRRKVREILHSAVDLNAPSEVAPEPLDTNPFTDSMWNGLGSPNVAGGFSTGAGGALQALQQQSNHHMQAMQAQMGVSPAMLRRPRPFETIPMPLPPPNPSLDTFAGWSRQAYLDSGCPPSVVAEFSSRGMNVSPS
jgi:hypothetical protein